ncbi:MAG TPA: hypothetical protein VMU69_22750 [Bradyrhizobium sp.]|nr:hypothetical protein [Bradyrhizobium sp.]
MDAKRDWTEREILEETERRHSGPGFFNVLATVGELIDFFAEHPIPRAALAEGRRAAGHALRNRVAQRRGRPERVH